jgi:hypothetical protein
MGISSFIQKKGGEFAAKVIKKELAAYDGFVFK